MISSEINLSPEQKKIVDHNDGAVLVLARAGSGKTRILTERIKRLLNVTKRKVLAITFTNKAGAEMEDRLVDSELNQEQVTVGTFHGFCQEVLEMRFSALGLKSMPHIFDKAQDRLEIVEQAITNTPSVYKKYLEYSAKYQKEYVKSILDFVSDVKKKLLTEYDLYQEQFNEDDILLFSQYQDILKSLNAIDFDDLIRLTYELFVTNEPIAQLYRRMYEFICIDEAQDMNYAQYELIKALAGESHKNVMMVGDPNQSIFEFNGASPEYMTTNFIEDFSPIKYELKKNYRCSKEVLKAADKIVGIKSNIDEAAIKGDFEIVGLNNEKQEVKWILDKVEALIIQNSTDIEGDVTYSSISILARNKYVFKPLEEELKTRNIPYYYKQRSDIQFESRLIKAFDLALRVKLNPDDKFHLRHLRNLDDLKNGETLMDLINQFSDQDLKKIVSLVISLKGDGSNFLQESNNLKNEISQDESINDDEKNMVLNDILELQSHWTEYARKHENKSLQQFKNSMALGKTLPLNESEGIALSTVHTMKGQEYDIIFIMGMDEGTFPDYRAIERGGVSLDQEKNNSYVAFTRARRFLYVSYPKEKLMPWGDIKKKEISRYLKVFAQMN